MPRWLVTTRWSARQHSTTFRRSHERVAATKEDAIRQEHEHNKSRLDEGMRDDGFTYAVLGAELITEALENPAREPSDLEIYLSDPGEVPGIGPEEGRRKRNGIARYVSHAGARMPHGGIATTGSYRYVLYVENQPVSALQVMSRDEKNAVIANVYTDPKYRRKGWASKLLARARKDFKSVEHARPASLSVDGEAWKKSVGENPVEDDLYPKAGSTVSGLHVRTDVPNTSSIAASIDNWEELPGIREVSFDSFTELGKLYFYSQELQDRTEALAREIQASGEINPLIVVIDENGPYVLEGSHRFDALRILGIRSFPAKVVIERSVKENPVSGGLICMGRKVEIDLRKPAIGSGSNSKSIVPPRDAGMLYDGSGTYWPKCSLLVTEFERGKKKTDEGTSYFGRGANIFEGNVDLPPVDLAAWQKLGEVDQVFYDRAGTKHPGFFRHQFNKPRGLWKVIWPFKRGAKSPAILYSLWQRRIERQHYRIELPDGCIVDDRGIAVP